jgi:hypothetical protein
VLAFVLYAVAGLVWTFALQLALGRPFIAIASLTGLFGLSY